MYYIKKSTIVEICTSYTEKCLKSKKGKRTVKLKTTGKAVDGGSFKLIEKRRTSESLRIDREGRKEYGGIQIFSKERYS